MSRVFYFLVDSLETGEILKHKLEILLRSRDESVRVYDLQDRYKSIASAYFGATDFDSEKARMFVRQLQQNAEECFHTAFDDIKLAIKQVETHNAPGYLFLITPFEGAVREAIEKFGGVLYHVQFDVCSVAEVTAALNHVLGVKGKFKKNHDVWKLFNPKAFPAERQVEMQRIYDKLYDCLAHHTELTVSDCVLLSNASAEVAMMKRYIEGVIL